MKQETRQKLVQIALSGVVFVVVWFLLASIGDVLVNKQEVIKWLSDRLKFLNPNISDLLVKYGWQLLVALFLSVLSYRSLHAPADIITRRCFSKGLIALDLTLSPNAPGMSKPEFLFIIPNPLSCSLILKKSGSGTTRVNRIELDTHLYRRFLSREGDYTRDGIWSLHFNRGEDMGLEWKKIAEGRWAIDTPFPLQDGEEVRLPTLDPGYDESDENAMSEMRELVGLSTIEVEFEVVVYTDQGLPTSKTLLAPFRVFLPLEEDIDGGVEVLVSELDVKEESERDSLRKGYQEARRFDSDVRKMIADRLNELEEIKWLDSHSEEIAPYDQAIDLRPNDPESHYARGHFLAENGIFREALVSADKALELGLNNLALHWDRARILETLLRPEEALNALDHVLAISSDDIAAHVARGRVLQTLGNFEGALNAHNGAIQLDSKLVEAHHGRGLALFSLDLEKDALSAFDRALELSPDFALAHMGRALTLTGQGRDDEVLKAIKEALKLGITDMYIFQKFYLLLKNDARVEFHRLLDGLKDKKGTKE